MMKQNLRLFFLSLLCAVFSTAWGETSTLTFNAKCNGSGTADDGAEWTVTSDGAESNFDSDRGIHYGTGSASVTYLQLATSGISGTITQVVVNACDAQAQATISVTVGGTSFTCSGLATATTTSANYSFTGNASGNIIVRVDRGSSMKKAIYVKSIVVTYTSASTTQVSTPNFSVAAGTYTEAQNVTISCATDGATIYYTTDGTDPSTSSSVYSSAISVTQNTTIKAYAVKDGLEDSGIVSATYNIKVATPTFDIAAGTYTEAQDVTITCATEGATIYYTTDGSVPTEESFVYSTPVSITTTGTILKAIAVKAGMTTSNVASATYTIQPNAPVITASEANVVTITADSDPIYYTTDGTAPTNESTRYTNPFTPERSCTVKAIAYDTYGNASTVAELIVTLSVTPRPKNINSNYYVKVTSANDLQDGDAILIVNENHNVAMGTQTTNNRASTYVTLSSDGIFVTSSDVQKIILVGATGAWYFCVGDEDNPEYLYAASSSSNYLRTTEEEDLDNNAKATITISSGNATILFQGSNTRNLLKYNSSNDIFSCYASGQAYVQIYKEVPAPTVPVAISEVGYATLYYGTKHLKVPNGVLAYTCKVNADHSITHTTTFEGGDVIPAGTAVLLQGAEGSYTFTESASAGDKTVRENMLLGYDTDTWTKGPNDATEGYKFFVLSLNAAGAATSVGFYYKVANGAAFTSEAHKAFLAVPNDIAEASSYVFDDQTGISNMKMTTNKEGVYTLSGVRVQSDNLPAGLYIVNGKKMVIK